MKIEDWQKKVIKQVDSLELIHILNNNKEYNVPQPPLPERSSTSMDMPPDLVQSITSAYFDRSLPVSPLCDLSESSRFMSSLRSSKAEQNVPQLGPFRSIEQLLQNNRLWAEFTEKQTPGFFEKLSQQQAPQVLWIGW
jgi:hypothetical protein